MDKQELMKHLLIKIENLGIEIIEIDTLPIPAIINVKDGIMLINPILITIFILTHELQHILFGDMHRGGENDACNPQEIRANKKAIEYLWDIFIENGGSYDYFSLFVDLTDCPFYMAYDIISKLYQEQENELNELDSMKDIDDKELQECIKDYISTFDIIDEINVYRFLEIYHLAYNLYERAIKIFRNIIEGVEYKTA